MGNVVTLLWVRTSAGVFLIQPGSRWLNLNFEHRLDRPPGHLLLDVEESEWDVL